MPVVNYFWNPLKDNVAEEYDENGDTLATYTSEAGLYGDLISQHRGGATSYYHYDGQGNTTALTNETGAITDTYAYNAFGEITEQTGTTENPYRYVGEKGYQYNEETSDYYIRERVYEPAIARWLSADPIGYDDSINRYLYGLNNAVCFVDPSGLFCMDCCCCAHKIELKLRDKNTERYGHIFDIILHRKLELHPLNGECTFEWWEWTDNPPKAYPKKCKNNWCELHGEKVQSWIFKKWDKRDKMPCPGEPEDVKVYDRPRLIGARPPRTRTIYFALRLLSSENCVSAGLCDAKSRSVCAVQYLKTGPSGRYKESFFMIIPCSPGALNVSPGANPIDGPYLPFIPDPE